jgi:zinc transporter, ZIP family
MLEAGLWAAAAAASLVVGAWLARRFTISRRVVGAAMGFGAGALVGALAYELIPTSNVSDGWIWSSFGVGALVFYGADTLLERQDKGGGTEGAGLTIALGALLDGVPESTVLGMSVAVGGSVSVGFLVAVFMSNVPESLSATAFEQGGRIVALLTALGFAVAAVLTLLD